MCSICIFAYVKEHMLVYAHMWRPKADWRQVFPSFAFLLLNPDHTLSASVPACSKEASSTPVCLAYRRPLCLPRSWGLNSAPQVWSANTLSTVSSLQPFLLGFSWLKEKQSCVQKHKSRELWAKMLSTIQVQQCVVYWSGVKETRSSYFICHWGSHSPVQGKVNW